MAKIYDKYAKLWEKYFALMFVIHGMIGFAVGYVFGLAGGYVFG